MQKIGVDKQKMVCGLGCRVRRLSENEGCARGFTPQRRGVFRSQRCVRVHTLTTDPNEVMEPVYARMPVILPVGHEKAWLPTGGVAYLIQVSAIRMTAYSVGGEFVISRHKLKLKNRPLLPAASHSIDLTAKVSSKRVGQRPVPN
jgi:hypothetical protein